jgi:hypothetical protein
VLVSEIIEEFRGYFGHLSDKMFVSGNKQRRVCMERDNARKGAVLEKKITFRLDAKRLGELEQFASVEGASVSFIVRHLVYRYIEQQRRFAVPIRTGACS